MNGPSSRIFSARRLALSLSIACCFSTNLMQNSAQAQNAQSEPKVEAKTNAVKAASSDKAATADQASQNNKESGGKNQRPDDVIIRAMQKELTRSFEKLKTIGNAPLYFLSYALYDDKSYTAIGSYGALSYEDDSHSRTLNIDTRIGSKRLDNTHRMRAGVFSVPPLALGGTGGFWGTFPIVDDEDAIRHRLWLETDTNFKGAQKAYMRVKANRDVKIEEEDLSDDFADAKTETYYSAPPVVPVDKEMWRDRVRKASAVFKEFPELSHGSVRLDIDQTRRYLVNTENTCIEDNINSYRLGSEAQAVAKDGMIVSLYDIVEMPKLEELPDEESLEKSVRKLCQAVIALKNSPKATPYVGPAILNSKACGVFFHEVLGHRVEGHRQKNEGEGRTFTAKVGEQIMPDFISVIDDPTRTTFGKTPLVGHYVFDDEGVPAQKVNLVDKGVLKGFLMSRSPINGFSTSNGHGRSSAGSDPVARQGNLIVDSSKRIPYAKLRAMLIAEAKLQHKPYGLIIDEISGGFTLTHSSQPQSYVLLPRRVTKVYVDGRPDEITRGVNIVGTPLSSLEHILCASTENDTFNGRCGAESGWVPVSATGPSLLLKTIELEKEYKSQNQPPVLPAPITEKKEK